MTACFRSRVLLAISLSSLLLAGCSFWQPSPEEVIARAVRTTQSLRSVRFNISAQLHFQSLQFSTDGMLTASGSMVDDGKLIAAKATFDGKAGRDTSLTTVKLSGDLLQTAQGDVDVKLASLSGQALNIFIPSSQQAAMVGTWVRVIRGETGAIVTPEPQVLTAQANAIKVTKDLGMTEVGDTKVAHYAVELDPERLRAYLVRSAQNRGEMLTTEQVDAQVGTMQAAGELWIDPATNLVRQVQWNVTDGPAKNFSLSLTMSLTDHNAAPAMSAPAGVVDWSSLQAPSAPATVPTTASGSDLPSSSSSHA